MYVHEINEIMKHAHSDSSGADSNTFISKQGFRTHKLWESWINLVILLVYVTEDKGEPFTA